MISDKHFVEFYSPGLIVSEVSCKPIDSWDPKKAIIIAKEYGRSFGFRFITKRISDPIDDGYGGKLKVEPRELSRSGVYYIDGHVETRAQVEARAEPSEKTLRDNMRIGEFNKVFISNRSKSTYPFNENDKVVDLDGNIIG
jgi:hypothetical protein